MCEFELGSFLQVDPILTHRQLTLNCQQPRSQNRLGIKEQPDKPDQIIKEFINIFIIFKIIMISKWISSISSWVISKT
jgi:hypothetical protein